MSGIRLSVLGYGQSRYEVARQLKTIAQTADHQSGYTGVHLRTGDLTPEGSITVDQNIAVFDPTQYEWTLDSCLFRHFSPSSCAIPQPTPEYDPDTKRRRFSGGTTPGHELSRIPTYGDSNVDHIPFSYRQLRERIGTLLSSLIRKGHEQKSPAGKSPMPFPSRLRQPPMS
jgi:hypothetical protein